LEGVRTLGPEMEPLDAAIMGAGSGPVDDTMSADELGAAPGSAARCWSRRGCPARRRSNSRCGTRWPRPEQAAAGKDDMYAQAVTEVRKSGRPVSHSATPAAHRLLAGARLIDELEANGIIGPTWAVSRGREVLPAGEQDPQACQPCNDARIGGPMCHTWIRTTCAFSVAVRTRRWLPASLSISQCVGANALSSFQQR